MVLGHLIAAFANSFAPGLRWLFLGLWYAALLSIALFFGAEPQRISPYALM